MAARNIVGTRIALRPIHFLPATPRPPAVAPREARSAGTSQISLLVMMTRGVPRGPFSREIRPPQDFWVLLVGLSPQVGAPEGGRSFREWADSRTLPHLPHVDTFRIEISLSARVRQRVIAEGHRREIVRESSGG